MILTVDHKIEILKEAVQAARNNYQSNGWPNIYKEMVKAVKGETVTGHSLCYECYEGDLCKCNHLET